MSPPTRVARVLALAIALPSAATVAQNADEVQLPEVGVKAQRNESEAYQPFSTTTGAKTNTPLRDIPASIVVIPKEVLSDQGAHTLNQALGNASSVAPAFGGGYGFADNYVIRGLRMRFLRDGLPDGPSNNGYFRGLADVQSIEVLKGPGSALYGRAEPGGSINITTKKPLAQRAFGAELTVGNLGTRQLILDGTGALGADVDARAIANAYHTDGIRGLKRDIYEVLPTLTWQANADHRFTFDYDYRRNNSVVDNYGIPFNNRGDLIGVDRNSRYYSPFNHVRQDINRFTLVHEGRLAPSFGSLSIRNSFVYDTRDIDLVRNAGGNVLNAANQMTGRGGRSQGDDAGFALVQSELVHRWSAGALRQTLLGGIEYESIRTKTRRYTYALPNIANGFAPVVPETDLGMLTKTLAFDRTIKSDTLSVYAQDQLELGPQVKVRAGGRFDRVDFSDAGIGNAVSGATPPGGVYRDISATQNLASGQIGAVYQPNDTLSFYTGYSTGKFINIQTESANLSTEPEKSQQIEVGMKTSLLSNRLDLNLAWFTTRRDNYYVTLAPGTEPVPTGKQKARGVELDAIGTPFAGFNIIGSYALIDARNISNELATVTGIATNQSVYGKFAQSTPRNAGLLWATYELQSSELRGLGFGFGVQHKGAAFVDSLELLKVPGYTIANAALFYRRKAWEAQLTVRNLTDKKYFEVPTFIGALPGEPRTVLLSLRMKI